MFQTLERSYLLKMKGKVGERPQHMLMRVAVGIHQENIDAAIGVCTFVVNIFICIETSTNLFIISYIL